MKKGQRRKCAPAVIVSPFARNEIVRRLQRALVLAADDLGENIDAFRDTIADVASRADAIDLMRASTGSAPALPARESRSVTILAARVGEPVEEFLLIPFGQVDVERPLAGESFEFTRAHADAAVAWFDRLGRKLAIDYEHQTFDRLNGRDDGLNPAAGWIGGLAARDDGLWAVGVEWTDKAAQMLRNSEYRYFSPVIFWADETRSELAGLGPVALTNDPAMLRAPALAAANESVPDDASLIDRLRAAESDVEALTDKLRVQEADTFVERGLRQGKIVESTSLDWRDDFLRDPQAAESRLSRAPILIPPGRVMAVSARGDVQPLRGAPPSAAGVGLPRPLATEDADARAYERAVAAGRVVFPSSPNS